jgi:hypothetical protein
MAFVLRAKDEAAAYGEKNGWVGLKRPSITLAVIPGSLIAVLLAAAAALYHYAPHLLPPPQGWTLYLPPFDSEPFVIGFMIFAFFCLTTPLSSVIAGRFSKRFAERDGWLAMSASDTLYGVETRLLIWLRRRRIGPDRPFDPGLFLRQAAHHWAPYWLAFLALFASALLYAGIHDQMAVLATGQGITVPGRWTFATRQYGYRDVVEVGLYCADERGHDFNFAYVVYFRDGSDVSFTTRRTLNHHLDAVVALDENLRRHNAFFNINFDFYETGCVKKLAKYEGGNSPERIERLFHLKEAWAQDAP